MVTLPVETILVITFVVAVAFLITVIDAQMEVARMRRWIVVSPTPPRAESGLGIGCAILLILMLIFTIVVLLLVGA